MQGDIHAETVGLVTKYIAGEEMIILAVAPATEDLHNAEAIALARKARAAECWLAADVLLLSSDSIFFAREIAC